MTQDGVKAPAFPGPANQNRRPCNFMTILFIFCTHPGERPRIRTDIRFFPYLIQDIKVTHSLCNGMGLVDPCNAGP